MKLVVKTFPSESFNLIEQLKSLDEIWNFSSSELSLSTYFGFWLAGLNKISAGKNYRNENSGTNVRVRLLSNLNEPNGRRFLQEVAFSEMIFS